MTVRRMFCASNPCLKSVENYKCLFYIRLSKTGREEDYASHYCKSQVRLLMEAVVQKKRVLFQLTAKADTRFIDHLHQMML